MLRTVATSLRSWRAQVPKPFAASTSPGFATAPRPKSRPGGGLRPSRFSDERPAVTTDRSCGAKRRPRLGGAGHTIARRRLDRSTGNWCEVGRRPEPSKPTPGGLPWVGSPGRVARPRASRITVTSTNKRGNTVHRDRPEILHRRQLVFGECELERHLQSSNRATRGPTRRPTMRQRRSSPGCSSRTSGNTRAALARRSRRHRPSCKGPVAQNYTSLQLLVRARH